MRSSPIIAVGTCLIGFAFYSPAVDADALEYEVRVRIEPHSSRIDAEVLVRNPPASLFYLNDDLRIRRVMADGREVDFHRDESTAQLPYAEGNAIIVESSGAQELLVEYTGFLKQTINDVNLVTADLVELALYSGWYPVFEGLELFDFELEANLPTGFRAASNGLLTDERECDGRDITRWVALKPAYDIALLASPLFQSVEQNLAGSGIEIFFHRMPIDHMQRMATALLNGMAQLSDLYGFPSMRGSLRVIYSPRGGWGYSRIPMIVVSEQKALEDLDDSFGRARDLHGIAHEMAHFWWSIADPLSPDDWINEGFAEFSAFRLSQAIFGNDFAAELLEEYREHASNSRTRTAIAETSASSPDRYVNRYEKPVLFLLEAQKHFGDEPIDRLLRAFYAKFAGTQDASTAAFLDEAENQLGEEAGAFFANALLTVSYSRPAADLSPEQSRIPQQ